MFIYDSLGTRGRFEQEKTIFLTAMRRQAKYGGFYLGLPFEDGDWTKWKTKYVESQKQMGYDDCGAHLCYFMYRLAFGQLPEAFDVHQFRKWVVWYILSSVSVYAQN